MSGRSARRRIRGALGPCFVNERSIQRKERFVKRFFLLVVFACLVAPAFAVGQESENLLQVYVQKRTPESFINAYSDFEAQRKDKPSDDASVMLALLNLLELERNLEMLKANAADLNAANKFQYANVLLEIGRYDEAIPLYEQLNKATPDWSCPWRHKGAAYYKLKNYAEAEKALLKAIETRKEHYDAYIWLAEVYRDTNQYEKGIKTLEEGLSYYGKDIEDPEKEYSSVDVAFLHLDLLKKAGKSGTEEYKHVLDHARKLAPNDARLKEY
jgi:tetratricopeptide (TPR) repeat protein